MPGLAAGLAGDVMKPPGSLWRTAFSIRFSTIRESSVSLPSP